MIAVVDAPSREAALSKVGLIALTVDLGEPHYSMAIAIRGAIASADCPSEVEHPVYIVIQQRLVHAYTDV